MRQAGGVGGDLGLVALGGALGTLARYGLGLLMASESPFAGVTFAVNLGGAMLLGLLISLIGRRHSPDSESSAADERGERLRLLLGTGVLGGFTTYSGLATETAQLLLGGQAALALAYAGATIVLGLGASLLGLWLGGRRWGAGADRRDSAKGSAG